MGKALLALPLEHQDARHHQQDVEKVGVVLVVAVHQLDVPGDAGYGQDRGQVRSCGITGLQPRGNLGLGLFLGSQWGMCCGECWRVCRGRVRWGVGGKKPWEKVGGE